MARWIILVALGVGVLIGLLSSGSIFGHGTSEYRIAVMQDGEDIRFRYQERWSSAGEWRNARQFRATAPREGVWYNGAAETLNCTETCAQTQSSSGSGSSGSGTSSGGSVSGRGSDVKEITLGAGEHRCTFQVSNNRGSYGGTNIVFKMGGRLQVNEIETSGTWTRLVDAGSGGSYWVEVDAASGATWSVTCR